MELAKFPNRQTIHRIRNPNQKRFAHKTRLWRTSRACSSLHSRIRIRASSSMLIPQSHSLQTTIRSRSNWYSAEERSIVIFLSQGSLNPQYTGGRRSIIPRRDRELSNTMASILDDVCDVGARGSTGGADTWCED